MHTGDSLVPSCPLASGHESKGLLQSVPFRCPSGTLSSKCPEPTLSPSALLPLLLVVPALNGDMLHPSPKAFLLSSAVPSAASETSQILLLPFKVPTAPVQTLTFNWNTAVAPLRPHSQAPLRAHPRCPQPDVPAPLRAHPRRPQPDVPAPLRGEVREAAPAPSHLSSHHCPPLSLHPNGPKPRWRPPAPSAMLPGHHTSAWKPLPLGSRGTLCFILLLQITCWCEPKTHPRPCPSEIVGARRGKLARSGRAVALG